MFFRIFLLFNLWLGSAFCHAANPSAIDLFDPLQLRELDQPGKFSFATVLGEAELEFRFLELNQNKPELARLKLLRLSELSRSTNLKYAALSNQITQDIQDLKTQSGIKMAFSSEQAESLAPQGNVARHFDPYWLSSQMAAFPLVGVINRLDRRDFDSQSSCGELRFIYRLAYFRKTHGSESRSTLPLLLNAVFEYIPDAQGSCQSIAQSWIKGQPLLKNQTRFKQLELNMQAIRFPSRLETQFGGQAIYLLRIFREHDGKWESAALENTPDVSAINKSPSLRADLLEQLQNPENLKKIDQGIFVLENSQDKLLAKRALSFSTLGRARLGNKPYTAVFGSDLGDLPNDFRSLQFVKSQRGLVERLNNLSCMGCHQSAGTAGFHVLGLPGDLSASINRVALPFSPHYYAERLRRTEYVQRLSTNRQPSTFRPHSVFPPAQWENSPAADQIPEFENTQVRDLCIPHTADFAIKTQCKAGTQCLVTGKNTALTLQIGECVQIPNRTAGHVCRQGEISNAESGHQADGLYNLNSFRDTITLKGLISDPSPYRGCSNTHTGTPLGRISKYCSSQSAAGMLEFADQLDRPGSIPDEICALQGSSQFDECARSSDPPECLAKADIVRASLDSCYEGHSCREDYICQLLPKEITRLYTGRNQTLIALRLKKLADRSIGFCVPNYFIFNMRTDGHPLPEGRIRGSIE